MPHPIQKTLIFALVALAFAGELRIARREVGAPAAGRAEQAEGAEELEVLEADVVGGGAARREPGHRAVLPSGRDAILRVHVTESAPSACSPRTARRRRRACPAPRPAAVRRGRRVVAAVERHDDDHRHRFLLGDQAVEDQVRGAGRAPPIAVSPGAVHEIEHGIAGGALEIARRQVHEELVGVVVAVE